MKKITDIIYVPKESLSNLIVSLLVVLAFIAAALIPGYLSGQRLNREISDARYKLDENKTLLPLYESLKRAPARVSAVLAVPGKKGLEMNELDSALSKLRDLSAKSAMHVIAIQPDLGNATGKMKSVAVNITLSGGFEDFRMLLLNLGSLPYLEDVENISIQPEPNDRMLDFNIKIIMRVGNG